MKKNYRIETDTAVYLYDNVREGLVGRWTAESFGESVLEDDGAYRHYLLDQNVTGTDIQKISFSPGESRESLRRYTFCRHLKGDRYACLDLRDLKQEWENKKRAAFMEQGPYDYMAVPGFRTRPIQGRNGGKQRRRVRRVQHSGMILNELSRYAEDKTVSYPRKKKKWLLYSVLDWDGQWIRNSRSWKDQTKKRKQWM